MVELLWFFALPRSSKRYSRQARSPYPVWKPISTCSTRVSITVEEKRRYLQNRAISVTSGPFVKMTLPLLFQTCQSPAPMAPQWHHSNWLKSCPRVRRRCVGARKRGWTLTTACLDGGLETGELTKDVANDMGRAALNREGLQGEDFMRRDGLQSQERKERSLLRIYAKRPVWTYFVRYCDGVLSE